MQINLSRAISRKIAESTKTFFFLPVLASNYIVENFHGTKYNGYIFRIEDEYSTKENFYFKLQIINRRAVFDISLRDILSNQKILYKLDPYQIPRIGYILKQEEIRKISRICKLKNDINKKTFLYGMISNFSRNINSFLEKILTKDTKKSFLYLFIGHFIHEYGGLYITLQITSTDLEFAIPVEELLKDFNILKNLDGLDLIKIGYMLKEEEMNNASLRNLL